MHLIEQISLQAWQHINYNLGETMANVRQKNFRKCKRNKINLISAIVGYALAAAGCELCS